MSINEFRTWIEIVVTNLNLYRWVGFSKYFLSASVKILGVLSVCLGFANSSSAQNAWGDYGSMYGVQDPTAMMQSFYAQQAQSSEQMMEYFNQKNAELINKYRQVSGDYSSSDQDIQARITAMSRQAYPEAWAKLHQNQMQHNQQMFQNTQNMLTQHSNDIRQINQRSNQYYDQTMDGLNQNYSNYLREQSPWVNPDTGEVSILPYGTPDTYYHSQGDQLDPNFYQSPDGQYFQYDSSGFATEWKPYYR